MKIDQASSERLIEQADHPGIAGRGRLRIAVTPGIGRRGIDTSGANHLARNRRRGIDVDREVRVFYPEVSGNLGEHRERLTFITRANEEGIVPSAIENRKKNRIIIGPIAVDGLVAVKGNPRPALRCDQTHVSTRNKRSRMCSARDGP